MDVSVPAIVIGLVSAIVVELLKLFPALALTDSRKRATALITSLVIGFIYVLTQRPEGNVFAFILTVLIAGFGIYKTVIQTIVEPLGQVFKIKHK